MPSNIVTTGVVLNETQTCKKQFSICTVQKPTHFKGRKGSYDHYEITTVGSLLRGCGPMPSGSILLGQCADGLPFLLELANPEMGAILVCCEEGFGKTHQLQVMVESAIRTYSPSKMQVTVLTLNPNEWTNLQREGNRLAHLQGVYAWHDDPVDDTIQALTDLADTRRQRTQRGPDILFILDDFNFVEELSFEAQVNLRWFLEYGAQSGVWLIGAINARYATAFRYWIDPFRTRVVGRVLCPDTTKTLTMGLCPQVAGLEPGSFQVYSGKEWVNYRLLPLGD